MSSYVCFPKVQGLHQLNPHNGLQLNFQMSLLREKDVGVPRRACSISAFHVARLRLNDGAKLWISIKHYLKTQNILQTFAFVALERNFLPKMELSQTFLQNFAYVASEKILSPKTGVASKFLANFCLCSIKKKLSTKNGVA